MITHHSYTQDRSVPHRISSLSFRSLSRTRASDRVELKKCSMGILDKRGVYVGCPLAGHDLSLKQSSPVIVCSYDTPNRP